MRATSGWCETLSILRNTIASIMDRNPHPKFIRQPKSKAIPIIDPNSLESFPPLVTQKQPCKPSPASVHPAVENIITKGWRSSSEDTKELPSSATSEVSHDESTRQALDIYARPFVPESFAIINKLKGHEINSPAVKQTNFGVYVSRFVGFDFLPPIPPPIKPPLTASFDLVDNVIHTRYEHYFRYHLEAEILSQKQ